VVDGVLCKKNGRAIMAVRRYSELMPAAEERPPSLSVTKDEVLRLARECRRRAARIQSDASRNTYLKVAAAWERMAREATAGDAGAPITSVDRRRFDPGASRF
jgi:hypothetical protein